MPLGHTQREVDSPEQLRTDCQWRTVVVTFANPAAFWGLLLAIPVIAVYLIRNRPSIRSVSTLLFWEQVLEERAATSLFRKLRSPGSLLFQLAILTLMVLTLSRPAFRSSVRQADRQILIIDNSASMQAVDELGDSRFDTAVAKANSIIDAAAPGSEIMLLASCPSATVICAPTSSLALAQIRLSELRPTDCVGQISATCRFAETITAPDIDATIVVITDGNESTDSTVAFPANSGDPSREGDRQSLPCSTIVVGQETNNVGITGFQARRDSSDPTLWQLYYEVSNFSDVQQELNLELRQDQTLIDIQPLQISAGQSVRRVVNRTSAEGGLIVGRLRTKDLSSHWSDGLSIDDRATTAVSSRMPIGVTLVTPGNWFLQQVLAANPLVRLNVVKQPSEAMLSSGSDQILIFDSVVPESWPPTDSRLPIKALVVSPTTSCRLWTVNGMIDQTFVGDYDVQHPLVEYGQLEDIAINSATSLTLTDPFEIVVSAIEGQPLLATLDNGRDRVVILAVDLEHSDLPLRTSFPILLTNTLDWLAGATADLLPQATTGQETTIPIGSMLPSDREADSWVLNEPSGRLAQVPVIADQASLGQLTQVGTYTLQPPSTENATTVAGRAAAPRSIVVPCNLVSKQESRLSQFSKPVSSDDAATGNAATGDAAAQRSQGIHFSLQNLLLTILLLAVIVECGLWHRRVIE